LAIRVIFWKILHRKETEMRRNEKNREARRKNTGGKRLCGLGWGLFGVSMFLPAVVGLDWILGWECAWLALNWLIEFLKGKSQLGGWSVYFAGFALANFVMLASPFLLRRGLHSKKWKAPVLLTLASALLTASYLPLSMVTDGVASIKLFGIGYYAWIASFWLVVAGVLKLRVESLRKAKVETPFTPPLPRTPEEMAAERELKDYLRGTVR
jgi:hypothetical protein